ncbi:ectonucleotide pyrophosphatase/phosphodiesterase [Nitrospirillum iridis]|uniref:Putative AlkP superfamily pyrophosphatase or phosphodiesterase n=1 Tax=Nitrospirillum iridis TaxID=765888 RepID=A0A7X0AX66_9PROT|nr:ectonucleotide pyrophosphatase/phosphodiesterase [Nitrospirillum iridis]MBB6251764.1 putative AlkP superfamily pyrophosphatase or phosphodiesterase [Nitrospirillum iridis]
MAALSGCIDVPDGAPLPSAAAPPPPAYVADAVPPPVILVSIDGFRADQIDRGATPTLAAVAADGVRAKSMRPSFPSLTFPNHYTLVTGLYPDHHGIVNNAMEDAELGVFSMNDHTAVADARWWNQATPLWVSVQEQGRHSGVMFWPGSEAPVQGVRPDHWQPFDAKVTPDQRVDTVLGWMDLPGDQRPSFITLYFDQVDHAEHEKGPGSAQADAASALVDRALARLVDGLKRRGLFDTVNLVIVSDHGMTATGPDRRIILDDLVDPAALHVVTTGPLAGIGVAPGQAAVAARLLGRHEHMECWRKQDLPTRFRYGTNDRVPAILCLADDGWEVTTRATLERNKDKPASLGDHGYDTASPAMGALFVAHGPAFRRGAVVPEFPNVDVYPLLVRLLAIEGERNDGHVEDVLPMLQPGA